MLSENLCLESVGKRWGSELVQLVISLILARLLDRNVMKRFPFCWYFIAMENALIYMGFQTSRGQKKHR